MGFHRIKLRNRRYLSTALYLISILFLVYIFLNPEVLAIIFPFIEIEQAYEELPREASERKIFAEYQTKSETQAPESSMKEILDLPFLPKHFICDNVLEQSGKNFTYSENYWDHADAFKSALAMNDLVQVATTNEFSWMLQELARMPFIKTICQTSFDAGASAFQWLVADENTVVHSFDKMDKNYSLEMTDFMSVEFPDAFILHEGIPEEAIPKFVRTAGGNVTCDVIYIAVKSLQPKSFRSNLLNLHTLANRKEHMIVLDSSVAGQSEAGWAREWTALLSEGLVTEQFSCAFSDIEEEGTNPETGLTIGMFK